MEPEYLLVNPGLEASEICRGPHDQTFFDGDYGVPDRYCRQNSRRYREAVFALQVAHQAKPISPGGVHDWTFSRCNVSISA